MNALCFSSSLPCLVTIFVLDLRSWVEEVTDATMPPWLSAAQGQGQGGALAQESMLRSMHNYGRHRWVYRTRQKMQSQAAH